MTSVEISSVQAPAATRTTRTGITLETILLICGVLSSLLYIGTDLMAAAQYPGYSLVDQAISELSAIGAPTKRLWSAMGAVYDILLIAFAIGVMRAAARNRALRVTGMLLLIFGASGVVWAFFPMHQRGAAFTGTDLGHIVLAASSVVLILLFIGFGGFALGRRFRVYSIVTMALLLAAGGITFSWAERIAAGEPTPWLGITERINIYGYLLWVAVFGVGLARRSRGSATAR